MKPDEHKGHEKEAESKKIREQSLTFSIVKCELEMI
jgi:hypothetical protein